MKKEEETISSRITSSFESSLNRIAKIYKATNSKKKDIDFKKAIVINPKLAKLSFIILMSLIFVSLSFTVNSYNAITSYSILNTVNPSANFIILFSLLALVFFLTYEKRKLK